MAEIFTICERDLKNVELIHNINIRARIYSAVMIYNRRWRISGYRSTRYMKNNYESTIIGNYKMKKRILLDLADSLISDEGYKLDLIYQCVKEVFSETGYFENQNHILINKKAFLTAVSENRLLLKRRDVVHANSKRQKVLQKFKFKFYKNLHELMSMRQYQLVIPGLANSNISVLYNEAFQKTISSSCQLLSKKESTFNEIHWAVKYFCEHDEIGSQCDARNIEDTMSFAKLMIQSQNSENKP